MGQYHKFVILNTEKKRAKNKNKIATFLSSYDYNNGAKLTEFSFINNSYCNAFEELINKEHGKYAGYPVIVAGDYAEAEPYTWNNEDVNLYDILCMQEDKKFSDKVGKHYRYIINEEKKLYIDTQNPDVIGEDIEDEVKRYYKYYLHPLPLMLSQSNGLGGGDYHGVNEEFVGEWARQVVVVSDVKPDETYKELVVSFFEEWGNN